MIAGILFQAAFCGAVQNSQQLSFPDTNHPWLKLEQFRRHDGVVFDETCPDSALEKVKKFDFLPDDVLVATYPKAGTTWMRELVYLITTEGDFEGANSKPIQERGPFLEMDLRLPDGWRMCGMELVGKLKRPRTLKTHLQYKFFESTFTKVKPKVIVVMRNLKDNLVSYYHFYGLIPVYRQAVAEGFHQFFAMYEKDELVHGDWFDFNMSWWEHRDDPNVLIVTYEEMKKDIRGVIDRVCKLINKSLKPEVIDAIVDHTSFAKMKKNPMTNFEMFLGMGTSEDAFMRKGTVGDWKSNFSQAQSDHCNKQLAEKLSGMDEIYRPSNF